MTSKRLAVAVLFVGLGTCGCEDAYRQLLEKCESLAVESAQAEALEFCRAARSTQREWSGLYADLDPFVDQSASFTETAVVEDSSAVAADPSWGAQDSLPTDSWQYGQEDPYEYYVNGVDLLRESEPREATEPYWNIQTDWDSPTPYSEPPLVSAELHAFDWEPLIADQWASQWEPPPYVTSEEDAGRRAD